MCSLVWSVTTQANTLHTWTLTTRQYTQSLGLLVLDLSLPDLNSISQYIVIVPIIEPTDIIWQNKCTLCFMIFFYCIYEIKKHKVRQLLRTTCGLRPYGTFTWLWWHSHKTTGLHCLRGDYWQSKQLNSTITLSSIEPGKLISFFMYKGVSLFVCWRKGDKQVKGNYI